MWRKTTSTDALQSTIGTSAMIALPMKSPVRVPHRVILQLRWAEKPLLFSRRIQVNREKAFDLLVLVFIVAAGLGTAYLTFGVLESTAQADIQKYSVGGAIAGALLSMSLLASVYQQFRKSSMETDALSRRVIELQEKLLRGTPCPNGFDTEVSERQHIVLARPKDWAPQGGVIFQSEAPTPVSGSFDVFPARFSCWFNPITKDTDDRSVYYDKFRESVNASYFVQPPFTTELMMVGGETAGVLSLRVMAHEYVRVRVDRDALTGRVTRSWYPLTKDDFESPPEAPLLPPDAEPSNPEAVKGSAAPANPDASGAAAPTPEIYNKMVVRITVVCYHSQLESIFFFEFTDDVEDFTLSSGMFNQILASVRFLT
jgi:hypothetical protein